MRCSSPGGRAYVQTGSKTATRKSSSRDSGAVLVPDAKLVRAIVTGPSSRTFLGFFFGEEPQEHVVSFQIFVGSDSARRRLQNPDVLLMDETIRCGLGTHCASSAGPSHLDPKRHCWLCKIAHRSAYSLKIDQISVR